MQRRSFLTGSLCTLCGVSYTLPGVSNTLPDVSNTLSGVPKIVTASSSLLIDDFTSGTGVALTGNRWMGFTDQVMGGRSEGRSKLDEIEGRPCIRLTGTVNTTGGGFIQLALDLGADRRTPFDGTPYTGLELDVYGNDEDYNCHLRTTDVRWYEQSYRATFAAPRAWTTVQLPWSAFAPHSIETPLNLKGLLRLGILGWMRDFEADIAVGRLALY